VPTEIYIEAPLVDEELRTVIKGNLIRADRSANCFALLGGEGAENRGIVQDRAA